MIYLSPLGIGCFGFSLFISYFSSFFFLFSFPFFSLFLSGVIGNFDNLIYLALYCRLAADPMEKCGMYFVQSTERPLLHGSYTSPLKK